VPLRNAYAASQKRAASSSSRLRWTSCTPEVRIKLGGPISGALARSRDPSASRIPCPDPRCGRRGRWDCRKHLFARCQGSVASIPSSQTPPQLEYRGWALSSFPRRRNERGRRMTDLRPDSILGMVGERREGSSERKGTLVTCAHSKESSTPVGANLLPVNIIFDPIS